MIKKTMVLGIIVLSLLVASASFVAADVTKEIEDPEDDVFVLDASDYEYLGDLDPSSFETTDEKPNIDIVNLKYVKEEQSGSVTLTLEVKGVIEDCGFNENDMDEENLDDLFSYFSEPMIMYAITLDTSETTYMISYMNGYCSLDYDEIEDYTVDGSKLIVTFDLENSDEDYVGMSAESTYIKYDIISLEDMNIEMFVDAAPDMVGIEVTADADPSKAEVNEEIDFSGDVEGNPDDYEFLWDFGDGDVSDERNPTHAYSEEGTFDVTLLVTDEDGSNFGSDFLTVEITDGSIDNDPSDGAGNVAGVTTEKSDRSGLPAFIALVSIIVIVGVAILVYIIRR